MKLHLFYERLKAFYFLLKLNSKASPLVEEAVLIGVALFIFILLGVIIFDLVGIANNIFSDFRSSLENIP